MSDTALKNLDEILDTRIDGKIHVTGGAAKVQICVEDNLANRQNLTGLSAQHLG